MLEDVICPSCGYRNSGGASACDSCNFPLELPPLAAAAADRPSGAPGPAGSTEFPRPNTLRRPQRRGSPLQGQSVWLWLLFGTFAAGILVWTGIQSFRDRNQIQTHAIAGSNPQQQSYADSARAALAADSTNIGAQIALANVLYDTGNWDEAIIHYKAALRRDSTRVAPMVDLGVCYYNLGAARDAEALFHQALRIDPRQPIALFNLGIVSDRRGETAVAQKYYRDALEHAPSDEFKATITAAMQRMAQKSAPAGK